MHTQRQERRRVFSQLGIVNCVTENKAIQAHLSIDTPPGVGIPAVSARLNEEDNFRVIRPVETI
jgi:hypothetical protein